MEDILRKLVAYHTVYDDEQSLHEALEYVAEFVKERGMYVEHFEHDGYESIFATVNPGVKRPKVLLAAHLDIVPADDDMFELRKANGKLYGRGVYDMKFALAAYLQVIDDIKDDLARFDIGLMVTCDEELARNQNSVYDLVNKGYCADVVVLPDGGRDWQIETMSKGIIVYTLEANGKSAHGSRPWEGDNAAFRMVGALQELLGHFRGHGPKTDTFNIGVIKGGEVFNKIPDYMRAEIEIRLSEPDSFELQRTRVTEICAKHGVTATIMATWPPVHNPLTSPYVQVFANCIEHVTGIKNTGFRSNGGNDARYFSQLGIPHIATYLPGGGFHASDEWISEKAFHQFREVLRLYLDQVAHTATSNSLLKAIENQPAHTNAQQAI